MIKARKVKWWGGFSGGRIDIHLMDDGWGGKNMRRVPAIFTSYKEARRQYQDVRRIHVDYLEGLTPRAVLLGFQGIQS